MSNITTAEPQVYEPTDDEVLQALERLKKHRERQKDYQIKRTEQLKNDPEALSKLQEARKAYNQGEKAVERRKTYYAKNKEKMKEYHKKYNVKKAALLRRAKELGLLDDVKSA